MAGPVILLGDFCHQVALFIKNAAWNNVLDGRYGPNDDYFTVANVLLLLTSAVSEFNAVITVCDAFSYALLLINKLALL